MENNTIITDKEMMKEMHGTKTYIVNIREILEKKAETCLLLVKKQNVNIKNKKLY